jgi:hypothetical protein
MKTPKEAEIRQMAMHPIVNANILKSRPNMAKARISAHIVPIKLRAIILAKR